MINDICINNYWQLGERYDVKNEKEKKKKKIIKKEDKNDKFPAPGIEPWPRTASWCGQMLYPLSCGELVCFEIEL